MTVEPYLSLLAYQAAMSLLSVGGVITLAPEQHRYMVLQQGWLTDTQFQTSITLAQVAPGPNVLFLALWGWHVGLNAAAATGAGMAASVTLGLLVGLVGGLAPSSVVAVAVNRWSRRHAERAGVKALRLGLAPLVVGAMLATAWVLGQTAVDHSPLREVPPLAVGAAAFGVALLVWRTRVHLLVLLGGGALAGWACQAVA